MAQKGGKGANVFQKVLKIETVKPIHVLHRVFQLQLGKARFVPMVFFMPWGLARATVACCGEPG